MLARFLLSSCVRLSVCPSVTIKAGIVSKRLDEWSWLLAWRLLSTLCSKEIWVSKNVEVCPKLWTRKISPRHGTSIALSTKLVVVDDSRACSACWRHLHVHASRRVVDAYYKSVTSISTGFCCTTCFHGRQDFHRQRVARSVCASTASCSYILAVPRHRARSLIKPRNYHCSMREGQISRDQTSIFAV